MRICTVDEPVAVVVQAVGAVDLGAAGWRGVLTGVLGAVDPAVVVVVDVVIADLASFAIVDRCAVGIMEVYQSIAVIIAGVEATLAVTVGVSTAVIVRAVKWPVVVIITDVAVGAAVNLATSVALVVERARVVLAVDLAIAVVVDEVIAILESGARGVVGAVHVDAVDEGVVVIVDAIVAHLLRAVDRPVVVPREAIGIGVPDQAVLVEVLCAGAARRAALEVAIRRIRAAFEVAAGDLTIAIDVDIDRAGVLAERARGAGKVITIGQPVAVVVLAIIASCLVCFIVRGFAHPRGRVDLCECTDANARSRGVRARAALVDDAIAVVVFVVAGALVCLVAARFASACGAVYVGHTADAQRGARGVRAAAVLVLDAIAVVVGAVTGELVALEVWRLACARRVRDGGHATNALAPLRVRAGAPFIVDAITVVIFVVTHGLDALVARRFASASAGVDCRETADAEHRPRGVVTATVLIGDAITIVIQPVTQRLGWLVIGSLACAIDRAPGGSAADPLCAAWVRTSAAFVCDPVAVIVQAITGALDCLISARHAHAVRRTYRGRRADSLRAARVRAGAVFIGDAIAVVVFIVTGGLGGFEVWRLALP